MSVVYDYICSQHVTPGITTEDKFISVCCRLELLIDGKDDDELLLLLLNTTDVLASCCEGTNPFIESICQTIFPVEELLEVC